MPTRLASLYDRVAPGRSGSAPPTLATERLELRPLRRSDAGLLALYAGEARVARMTSTIPHPYPPGAALAFIEASATMDRGGVWAIDGARCGLPEVVGTVALRSPGPHGSEIGYWIAPPFWNHGLATEAVRAVVAADPFGGRAFWANVFQDNPASAHVLEAVGFGRTGEGEVHSVARGEAVRTWIYRRAPGDAA